MNFIKRYLIARRWQSRAKQLWEKGKLMPPSWDCDVRREILIKEMAAEGLKLGVDFVVVWAGAQHRSHTFLELFGKNDPFFRLNGYRIDAADPYFKLKFDSLWKGEYKSQKEQS